MFVDVGCDLASFQMLLLGCYEIPLHFPVEAVSHQFQHDVGVGIDAGILPLVGQGAEYLVHVGHVEVAADHRFLAFQLLRRSNGWTYLIPL